jgi:ubiquinone/menaquinone biosynthesis C-methylase UbiE
MTATKSAQQIKQANVRYHDLAAFDYDAKWAISYTQNAQRQVVGKLEKALGTRAARFANSLEIGAGTGYFTLNLLRAGVIGNAVATDISPNMLAALAQSAESLGLDVSTKACDATDLPFADQSFDLVFGHAVLHHLPDLEACFCEFRRVLKPNGTLVFCGEPSRLGDSLAKIPKSCGSTAAPLWRKLVGATQIPSQAQQLYNDGQLEPLVDVHTFTPTQLQIACKAAGFESPRVVGEELVAGWFGWLNRCLEANADPGQIPRLWQQYAFRGYLALQKLDSSLLERHLPPAIFYNLLMSARAPS